MTMSQESSWSQRLSSYLQLDNIFTLEEKNYLRFWLDRHPSIHDIWTEMDQVWDRLDLDNTRSLSTQNIHSFYSHPVWTLNGIFTGYDSDSVNHRIAIAKAVLHLGVHRMADYGGGFGELAKRITTLSPEISIDIIEPYPSNLAEYLTKDQSRIRILPDLIPQYDLVIAQDVLEHTEDPITLVDTMCRSTVDNGYLIFANCFKPIIKCHLPSTFHLRHTFSWVIAPLGLTFHSKVPKAEHAHIYKYNSGKHDLQKCRQREILSKKIHPILNATCTLLRRGKRIFKA